MQKAGLELVQFSKELQQKEKLCLMHIIVKHFIKTVNMNQAGK